MKGLVDIVVSDLSILRVVVSVIFTFLGGEVRGIRRIRGSWKYFFRICGSVLRR